MRWERGRYSIEMTDQPGYSFGSSEELRPYDYEYLLTDYRPFIIRRLVCFEGQQRLASAVVGASHGAGGLNERSCVLLGDRCFLAVGPWLLSLDLPDLSLLWKAEADSAGCFGLHLTPDRQHIVVHGEVEISKFTLAGRKSWTFSGRDIFTGEFAVSANAVVATDFNGQRYSIDLERGTE
jgi:hypothetical protein